MECRPRGCGSLALDLEKAPEGAQLAAQQHAEPPVFVYGDRRTKWSAR